MTEIERAVDILRRGGLVAFPTETVYGLGADATNPEAVARIFAAKGRPAGNPLIVHVADMETAKRYAGRWSDAAQTLAAVWWPGPLTLVVSKHPSIADAVTAGGSTVGLRVPDHPIALELLRAFDGPIAAPSANRSNHISPTTADHVREELGDAVDAILDGGPCNVGIESTVLDLTGDVPTILRPGGLPLSRLQALLGDVRERVGGAGEGIASSPGQQPVHYAPRTPCYRFETSQRGLIHPETNGRPNGVVLLSPLRIFENIGNIVAMPNDPPDYARRIYAILRELDANALSAIYVEVPPDRAEWSAVRDRIMRASKPLPAR